MFDLDKLKAVTTIVCHANCPDGLASAMFLRDVLPDAEIVFAQHGTDEFRMLTPKPGMLFCDIAPYIETIEKKIDGKKVRTITPEGYRVLDAWVESGTFVLDHHKTVKEIVARFVDNGTGVFGDEVTNPGVCGAVLAYEHVWQPLHMGPQVFAANFARLSGIRDTWQKKSPDFREASLQAEVLMFYPRESWLEMSLGEVRQRWDREFRPVGEVLMRRMEKSVENIAANGYRFSTAKGTRVVCFDALKKSSDVAEKLGSEADLVIGFCYVSDPALAPDPGQVAKLLVSTRSHTGYNCEGLASHFGGGGHTAAAGFNRVLDVGDAQPFTAIRKYIEEFEAQ